MSDANKERNAPVTREMVISAIIKLQTDFLKIPLEEAVQKTIKAFEEPYTQEEADAAVQRAIDHGLLTPEEAANKLKEPVTIDELADLIKRLRPFITDLMKAAAAVRQQEEPPTEETSDIAETLPRVKYHPSSERMKISTDKLTNVFFSFATPALPPPIDGQRQMLLLKYEGANANKEITLYYDVSYDDNKLKEFNIEKGFDGYDFFVASIIDKLFDDGNTNVSYTKILEEMGEANGKNRPAPDMLERLWKTLFKGSTTRVYINDREVQIAWGNTKEEDTYTEKVRSVLPIDIENERFVVSGLIAKGTIKINSHTVFREISESLGHLDAWDTKILRLYTGRKTDRYWNLMQGLINTIGWMRSPHGKRSPKLLYSLVYTWNNDTTKKTQHSSRNMVFRLLDEVFIPAGYVKKYKEAEDGSGIMLTVTKKQNLLKQ